MQGCTIVYVRSRQRTKEIAITLQQAGISADFFHAGLNREEKTIRQNRWKNDECRVIVATNAFGMGIDKPNVRLVIHIDMPGSLEEYFQEAGRAGRDGEKAYAIALCAGIDNAKLKKRLTDEYPEKDFIYRVYEALGNYYQIAVGFGLDTVHEFSLADFCQSFRFPILPTHHALKILELSGYIEYTEEIDNASRICFNVSRDDLYYQLQQDKKNDAIIQTLLRSYTGLFAGYVYINEALIASRSGYSQQEIYDCLMGLSKYRVVNYIPHKRTPFIVYTQTREDMKHLAIPRSAYEERKAKSEKRTEKVLDYINETNYCRSRILLAYFGEKSTTDCGVCDICIARKNKGLTTTEFNAIKEALTDHLQTNNPASVKAITDTLPFPEEKCIEAIRLLCDNDEGFTLSDGNLSYREP
jgi:ATP-dependent DNA helicase RecQ